MRSITTAQHPAVRTAWMILPAWMISAAWMISEASIISAAWILSAEMILAMHSMLNVGVQESILSTTAVHDGAA